jgi:hypothetical protein
MTDSRPRVQPAVKQLDFRLAWLDGKEAERGTEQARALIEHGAECTAMVTAPVLSSRSIHVLRQSERTGRANLRRRHARRWHRVCTVTR